MTADLVAQRLHESAWRLFRANGFDAVTMGQIASDADCALDELYVRFPRKESFVLRQYAQTAHQLREYVVEAPALSVASRFEYMVRCLVRILKPQRELYRSMLPSMLDADSSLGVMGQATSHIRGEVQAVYRAIVLGAEDRPADGRLDSLVQCLYFAHLGFVFLFLQDQHGDDELTENNILLAADFVRISQRVVAHGQSAPLSRLGAMFGYPRIDEVSGRVNRLVESFVRPPHDPKHFTLAEQILRELMRFRRIQGGSQACADQPCSECLALHLPAVERAIENGRPIQLVLPAFPAKSANQQKVLGRLPDLGEALALRFLQSRCDDIAKIHAPGAELVICSDGRVFSDLVGVEDKDVTRYRESLVAMIDQLGLKSIEVFDLDDIKPGMDFSAMRTWLLNGYGESRETVESRVRAHESHQQLFNGIHRFLFEDIAASQSELSRTKARQLAKDHAYEVIRRSNAWSRVVGECFGDAVRLSIHPHAPHSDKIGILLGEADDLWLTPWHGVILLQDDRYLLTRRANAEAQGAKLVTREGRPSHFESPSP